jgi:TolB-like protein
MKWVFTDHPIRKRIGRAELNTSAMGTLKTGTSENGIGFSPQKIRSQMAKIFASENFRTSETLKTFLLFIVDEKLAGRENQLKEYTIAINVLHKDISFKPQENCIVRIHAVRLRKALAAYYETKGLLDEIRISLPKGSYVPQFSQNIDLVLNSVLKRKHVAEDLSLRKPFVIALIPFHSIEKNGLSAKFSDILSVQLSSSLTAVNGFAVISHSMVRRLPDKFLDIKGITDLFDTDLVVTGDILFQNDVVRVYVQVIRTDGFEQVWSMMAEKKITQVTMLSVLDEIVKQIAGALQLDERIVGKSREGAVMAVA